MAKFAFVVLAAVLSFAAVSHALTAEGEERRPVWPIEKMQGVHPRLHVTAARLQELRRLVKEDATYAGLFEPVKKKADKAAADGPTKYIVDDKWSGKEQLWQREVGETIPELAMAYLMTGDAKYFDAAQAWMIESLDYETWGLEPFEGNDLAAGHQLYGIALAYDWLWNDLDEVIRQAIAEKLTKRARFMYNVADTKEAYWADSYLQNHLWVNITGLAACGFALYGEVEEAGKWIALPLEKYKVTFGLLPADGSSFEGVPYWGYGVEYMLKFMDLARPLLGEDFYKGSEFWKNTSYFRIYSSLPPSLWARKNNLMSFGDSPRWDWYGPDYILRRLAAEYRDPYAQGFANEVDDAKVNAHIAAFLNVLWYDPTVEAKGTKDLPAFKHFEDLGLAFMRSDWSGNETVCAFKCGPHIGKHALSMLSEDPGSGHVHPDEGAFQIMAYGDWLIVDDGYAQKWTEYQNTLLVNGVGQEGEGYDWFRGDVLCKEKRGAKILRAESSDEIDFVIGDATGAYKKAAGLKKFVRSVFYLKPAAWVIVDEVEAEEPSKFEFYYHGEYPFEKAGYNLWRLSGKKAALDFVMLLPRGASGEILKQELKGIGGEKKPEALATLKISNGQTATKAVFLNVLCARPAESKEAFSPELVETKEGAFLTVKTPGQAARKFRLVLERSDPAEPVLDHIKTE